MRGGVLFVWFWFRPLFYLFICMGWGLFCIQFPIAENKICVKFLSHICFLGTRLWLKFWSRKDSETIERILHQLKLLWTRLQRLGFKSIIQTPFVSSIFMHTDLTGKVTFLRRRIVSPVSCFQLKCVAWGRVSRQISLASSLSTIGRSKPKSCSK